MSNELFCVWPLDGAATVVEDKVTTAKKSLTV